MDEKSPTLEEEPSTIEEMPPTMEKEPQIIKEKHMAMEEPPTTEAEPPTTEAEPPTTEAEPPTTEAEPPTTETESPATENKIPTIKKEPPVTDKGPPAMEKDPAVREESPTIREEPITLEDPPMTEEKPSMIKEEPPAIEEECSSVEDNPPFMEEIPRYLPHCLDAENVEDYREGGYCPVDIGNKIADRFKIVHKLGHGGFGTVWLAREEAKGRFVALKIITAHDSKKYEAAPSIAHVRQTFPAFILAEHERLFVDSPNGRHLCQVFPVLGPTLDAFTDPWHRLYQEYLPHFARQIVHAIETIHSNNLCHGDLTARNIAFGLAKTLDHLSDNEIHAMFPPLDQEIRLSNDEVDSESRAPKYAVEAMNLTRLPSGYLSSKLYLLDFDQAYSSLKPPECLLGIPPKYSAPESIFESRNGPPADIWALGCLLFRMRCGFDIFRDFFDIPANAAIHMFGILGKFQDDWKRVPFDDAGFPVHDGKGGFCDSFNDVESFNFKPLRNYVMLAIDPKRPKSADEQVGVSEFCRYLPPEAFNEMGRLKEEWAAENATPIRQKEADSFTDLMLQVFEYDPNKRITASAMLLHPWFEDT